jgi:hypothetical protein
MVLVDDLLGTGQLSLLVSTMSGNVFCFGTSAPYHPLNTWTAQTQHGNGFTARSAGYHGIYVEPHSRVHRDVLVPTHSPTRPRPPFCPLTDCAIVYCCAVCA